MMSRFAADRPTLFAATVLAFGMLAGCASGRDTSRVALLAPDLPFRTPGPRELGASVRVTQLITARYQGETYAFETQLSVSPERLTLVCIDPFGRRALTVVSTGADLAVDAAPWLPDGLRPENILADMAVVYWPAEAVRSALYGTSATMSGDARHRAITVHGREVVRVEYDDAQDKAWSSSARYKNNAFGYELILRSASVAE
jgi:hypothetical protein